jgi:ABC-type uncharacterized transport system ATPase subunit
MMAVELRGLTKHFGSVLANAGVNLRIDDYYKLNK